MPQPSSRVDACKALEKSAKVGFFPKSDSIG
jgi:hypothetical protein